jgi:hypothetical protein
MKLLIFYLTDSGRHFTFSSFVNLLKGSKMKDQWKLIVLSHNDSLNFYSDILRKTDIQHEEFLFDYPNNYLNKVNFAIQYAKKHGIQYMMKCDNDIFFRERTLDYMIDNLSLLETESNITLGPLISSGIPCVEYFISDFLNPEQQFNLKNKFLQTEMKDIWGAKFTQLNEFTLQSKEWNGRNFLNGVKNTTHYYKGIHPIRVNLDAINYLNYCILENKSKFYEDLDLSIIEDNQSPYLCNSAFCIKTSTYETIINDKSLYEDSYDEVALNKYVWKNNLTHLFVKNGVAIHPYYNTIPNNIQYEHRFCSLFFQ